MSFLYLYVSVLERIESAAGRGRSVGRDSGQGAVEYVGLLVIAAAVIGLLWSLGIVQAVPEAISNAVNKIFRSENAPE